MTSYENVPLWLKCAIAKLHDMVDLTDPDDPIGIALTQAGLERRPTFDTDDVEDAEVVSESFTINDYGPRDDVVAVMPDGRLGFVEAPTGLRDCEPCAQCGGYQFADLTYGGLCVTCELARNERPSTPLPTVLSSALRRAQAAHLPATLTQAEWQKTVDHFANRCAFCGGPWSLVDHATPIMLGGGTTADNCLPSCIRCNVVKGGRELESFKWGEQTGRKSYLEALDWLWSCGRQTNPKWRTR